MKIETSVDKIMELIKLKKKISISKCAKELNMSTQTIEEWAKTLEEEGLIIIQYKFGGPYLVEKDITPQEEQQKINKIDQQREFHIQDSDLGAIDEHSESLNKISQQVSSIKQELESELGEIKTEIKKIETGTLESGQSAEEKKFFIKQINTLNKKLEDEDKKMEKTIGWINFFRTKIEQQDEKIKKIEKEAKT